MKRITDYAVVTVCCLFAGLALIHVANGPSTAEEKSKSPEAALSGGQNIGTVVMWWGSKDAIPAGWEICDGEMPKTANSTLQVKKPNLTDRFPKGATSERKSITDLAQATGGSNNMPALRINTIAGLKIAEDGAHSHAPSAQTAQKTAANDAGQAAKNQPADNKNASKAAAAQNTGTDNLGLDRRQIVQASGSDADKKVTAAAANDDSSSEGKHSHDIKGFIGSEKGINADGDDKSGANQPAFAELFFIIRVK